MPRGFGRGDNWRRSGRGMFWAGYPQGYAPAAGAPKDAAYLGPCRCGRGPRAYYRLADGEVVHATGLPYAKETEVAPPETTHEGLEAEVERLRGRVQELEKRLKESSGTTER